MLIRRAVTGALLAFATMLASITVAAGSGLTCPKGQSEVEGRCVLTVVGSPNDPGTDPSPGTPGTGSGGGAQEERVCIVGSTVMPCESEDGTWNDECYGYAKTTDPQPPADDPIWAGHGDGGVIMTCTHLHVIQPTLFWVAAPPTVEVSPRALADQAVEEMDFRAGTIGITPPPGPGKMGIIGLPTWLWITDPDEHTVGPITRSATAGGTTVTATGTLDHIAWTMGDGTTVTCTGPGTPYVPAPTVQASPTCGHTYTSTSAGRPDEKYTVTATSYWTVTWAGGGQAGTIPLTFSTSTQIRIGELQTLITTS